MISPGLGPVEHVGQHDAGLGGAGVADDRREVVGDGLGAHADAGRHDPCGPGVHAGDDEVVDGVGGDAGLLEGVGDRLLGQRHVGVLAEALLPLARGLARDAPAVEELAGGGRRADRRSANDGPRLAEHEGGGGVVAAVALVGAAGQAGAHVGQHEARRRRAPPAHGADAGAHGADHVVGRHRPVEAEGGVDGGGVGLVEVGRVGGGEAHSWPAAALGGGARAIERPRRPSTVVSSS